MKSEVSIDSVRAQAFEIPTDKPEADGTIDWNSTTLVLVQISGGGKTGIGYTYSSASIVDLICGKLAATIEGSDAFNPQAAWLAMQRAVRNSAAKVWPQLPSRPLIARSTISRRGFSRYRC
jgi:L-alanine-DL-glutamate epimerase-like enolase superfamily enzyme